jgi:hypothetical protein
LFGMLEEFGGDEEEVIDFDERNLGMIVEGS